VANTRLGNIIYIDTASEQVSTDRNSRIIGLIYTSSGAGDQVVLRESSTGADKIAIKNGVANDTKHLRMEESPIIFGAGIYVQSISSGSKLMLIVSQSGAQ
jgi:hypothetical protein